MSDLYVPGLKIEILFQVENGLTTTQIPSALGLSGFCLEL